MRKSIIISLILVMVLCSSCQGTEEQVIDTEPQVSQMKSICELAAVDCYYHNVAKYREKDAEGILLWKKDKHFWVEYDGIVTIGIDASLLEIKVKDENVTISMPPAKVLSCKVDEKTLTEDSFVVARDSARIDAETQTEAFKEAQGVMEKNASEDAALLSNAQERAKKLLEDYVKNIGDAVGKKYVVKWVNAEDKEG